ncbi:hypothetical protein Dimus_039674 [Dionaea muscipula]
METNQDEESSVPQHFMPQPFLPQTSVPPQLFNGPQFMSPPNCPQFMPPPHVPSLADDEQPRLVGLCILNFGGVIVWNVRLYFNVYVLLFCLLCSRMQMSGLPCESSHSSSDVLFTPQVKDELVPKIHQEFDNLDDVHKFYNNYAKESGFGTRSSSSRKNRQDVIIRKEFCCSKEGVGVELMTEQSSRCRGISRRGCGAKIAVVKRGEKYIVTQFVEGHNHPLTSPRRVHLLRSHRKVSSAKKALAESLSAVNMPSCQQMSLFEMQSGGAEHVGFLQQDLYNVERDRRKSIVGHDADMLYEYFQMEKEKNVSFTFAVERDDEGRMTHCFWADATARKSYQYFGDVVVFDTTYNTNRYSLIFAPILGVNHHRQTTLFGCAFLSDETTESFEWLFKVWLKAMPADPPRMIITDQDPAMTKAIARTMPTTHHRSTFFETDVIVLHLSFY